MMLKVRESAWIKLIKSLVFQKSDSKLKDELRKLISHVKNSVTQKNASFITHNLLNKKDNICEYLSHCIAKL